MAGEITGFDVNTYKGKAHEYKTTHSVERRNENSALAKIGSNVSGLSRSELQDLTSDLSKVLSNQSSANPEDVEFAQKQLDYFDRLVNDPDNKKNLENDLAKLQTKLDREMQHYSQLPDKNSWITFTKKFDEDNPLPYTRGYLSDCTEDQKQSILKMKDIIAEMELTSCNVISYTTILKHNGMGDYGE